MSKTPKAYPVGYKKPPASGQFKKGQSGNPSGKKKAKCFAQVLQDQLEEEIVVKTHGGMVKLAVKEVLIKKMIQRAMGGDVQCIKLILQHASQAEANDGKNGTLLSDHEIQQLKDLLNGS